jgi:ceramide glucosyltransferase
MTAEQLHLVVDATAYVIAGFPLLYLLYASGCVYFWKPQRPAGSEPRLPITVLKPVCGFEPSLYANLKTFCRQDYPAFQVVFGVSRADDAAVPVLRRLIDEHPHLDLALVIDGGGGALNPKVNNLANMERAAKHGFLVIADSDVRVGEGFLDAVAHRLQDPRVGVLTCLYTGQSGGGLVSRLGALSINEWFIPSVLVARSLAPLKFCLGAAVAIRREVLEQIGGFAALQSYIADDYMLGRLVRDAGYEVELLGYTVCTSVSETSLAELWHHEVRWARTIRTMEPVGHLFSVVTLVVPMAFVAALLSQEWMLGVGALVAGVVLRMAMGYMVEARLGSREQMVFWLAPVRDVMSFVVWIASFLGRRVAWRGASFRILRDGRIEPVKDAT